MADGSKQFKPLKDGDKIGRERRFLNLRADGSGMQLDEEARTLTMSFSSEYPVERWFGNEVLSHASGCADLSRLNNGAPLLFNHDMDDLRGVVESARIDPVSKKGICTVRFARTPEGDQAMALVADGVLRNVSFAYEVRTFVAETGGDGRATDDTYTATDWMAYEISLVTVPADPTVGVGRAHEGDSARPIHLELRTKDGAPAPVSPQPAADVTAASAASTNEEDNTMRIQHRQFRDKAGEGGAGGGAAPAIDEAQIRREAALSERERVAAITTLAERHKLPAEALGKLISEGTDLAGARGVVLEHVGQNGQKPVAALGHQRVDMTDREARSYSLMRAVKAALDGDWSKAGFEREVSQALAASGAQEKRKSNTPGFFMPSNLPFCPTRDHERAFRNLVGKRSADLITRAIYQVGTAAQGGNLIETDLLAEDWISVLRNIAVVTKLGARMLTGLVGNVDIPRQTSATSAYWVPESGALTETEATFDKVSLRPRTVGALSKMSRLMLLQSTPAIEMIARMDMLAVLALAIDLAALSGSGASGQPTGIVNQAGVGSVVGGANGANVTFDNLIQLYTQPAVANAPFANNSFAMNARTRGYLATQKTTTGAYLWTPGQGGGIGSAIADNIQGYPYEISNQLRGTLTKGTGTSLNEIIFGNWSELLIGEWGVTEVALNPYGQTDFTTGDVAIRAFQTLDIALRHGPSFSVMSDAATPGF